MKNYVYLATSLDGFIATKDGGLDWLPSPDINLNLDLGYEKFIEKIDAIVMGRNTFETVCSFGIEWPYTKPVFVVSNSLSNLPKEFVTKEVSLIKGTPQELMETIHKKGFKNLYIDGGINIQNFLKEDLIDEVILTVIPILLGEGKPLFSKQENRLKFECINSSLDKGIVQNHFVRVK